MSDTSATLSRADRLAALPTDLFAPAHLVIGLLLVVGAASDTSAIRGLGWGALAALLVGVLPYAWVLHAVRRGRFSSHHIPERTQRMLPLAIAAAAAVVGLVTLAILGAPRSLVALIVAMFAGLAVTVAVTRYWKISLHTGVAAGTATILVIVFGPVLLTTGVPVAAIGWSRVRLRDHTPPQVTIGAVTGAIVAAAVFLPLQRPANRSPRWRRARPMLMLLGGSRRCVGVGGFRMVTVATYNLENLFSRPKAFNTGSWAEGEKILAAYREFNTLIAADVYSDTDVATMRELLVELGVYYRNTHGAIRRRLTPSPAWAWLRKNRGSFDSEPRDATKDVEITATGRSDWIGWLELATEATDEIGTRLTARVIRDVDADILAVVEAEDRPSLLRLNAELLDRHYRHVMLVDGNDERGIDVGIMTKTGFRIGTIRSHVDAEDDVGIIFSRDCLDYQITTPTGTTVHVLVNHFKSQSGGGGPKRRRQAIEVRRLVDELVARGEHVIVLGDLNEGQPSEEEPAENLAVLFDPDGPLVSCFDLDGFDVGNRPGTYGPCTIRNRLDYILISHSLVPAFTDGHMFRNGLWGSRKTRPTDWDTYPEMTSSVHQASDHAAVVITLDL